MDFFLSCSFCCFSLVACFSCLAFSSCSFRSLASLALIAFSVSFCCASAAALTLSTAA